ncbi:hypothetical protein AAFF_G00276260 [Aldrovandia affinis]|uniref:Uncharacterized protein n=1 Tax=Aldrovandia affinis TaxID=143900 RepID=A0AAD7RAE8_9TELE|nr:hypothetical protein AAFF_G00276260 [Aldrovandia affinis]
MSPGACLVTVPDWRGVSSDMTAIGSMRMGSVEFELTFCPLGLWGGQKSSSLESRNAEQVLKKTRGFL